jgi:superfamily II DNA or RNA helicase
MTILEDIKPNSQVKGILPSGPVTVLSAQWHGSDVVEVTYRDVSGKLGSELLFRDRQADLEVSAPGHPWAFDADPEMFRLVSEAYRIRMAYLFDPWLAVHLSQVEPLPHQITAVYGEMLPRQPLRFLLADDPGAGKTIMTGLFIKELLLRGDLQRCLIVSPGSLTEQWQDELWQKFQLPFELLTNDKIEAARTGNALNEMPLVIARLDKFSRDEDLQAKLQQTDWDLVVFDEAHKLSASIFGGEIKYTKRYRLGQLLANRTRHLLLLTATPHNGKEEDFQLFMGLLDPDRFEGKYREGVHDVDASDLMRRLVKEQLRKFDGKPLFPERRAYTVDYDLSDLEAALYEAVTRYVSEEFNRADNLDSDRRNTVGFALTMLQRRLASSPEAIYQSLRRRKERLESRLRETRLLKRGVDVGLTGFENLPGLDVEGLEDLEDAPEGEQEQAAEQLVDLATAARTIHELELEIAQLRELETLADRVRRGGTDRKWQEMARILQDESLPAEKDGRAGLMFDSSGQRRKLVIFTEHRDTLNYLAEKIRLLLGKPEAVVTIHGGMQRDNRRAIQASFVQDKDVFVLVATDAAGEGINLQRAHLMVNYDLPWNPARIEQRFGRIHRIGQNEVCHLWNLVADETREGDVYARLLHKIEEQRRALGDGVFDILGKLFRETSLRELLLEAIRYGNRPDVRDRLNQAVDNLVDRKHCQDLLEDRALARDSMDISQIQRIRQDFERAQARRLQPHFIESFFKAAFEHLGGTLHKREGKRFEITHTPAVIRNRSFSIGRGTLLNRYERVTFYKEEITTPGKPLAEFLCPGHPLMDAVIDLVLERYRGLLRQGAILVDENDPGEEPRLLVYLEESIQDGRADRSGQRRVIARQMQFVEMGEQGKAVSAGPAPFLNYKPLPGDLRSVVEPLLAKDWLKKELEASARAYAVQYLVPQVFNAERQRREEMVTRTIAAVKDRLTKEISYWDHRAQDLKAQEQAGRVNARLNSELAQRRADELQSRLQRRMEELEQERHLSAQPPVVLGAALVLPATLLAELQGQPLPIPALFAKHKKAVELAAMQAVMEKERSLGYLPVDVSRDNLGWDIESAIPGTGKLRFIEVKGRIEGAETVTVSKNEILAGLNKPEDYWLVIVKVNFDGEKPFTGDPDYRLMPFRKEPDFGATSVNYNIRDLDFETRERKM